MEQATKTQVIQEAKLFNELWALLKKYYNVTMDSDESVWEEIVNEAGRIGNIPTPYKVKHNGRECSLSTVLVLDVIGYIEQMAKDRGHIKDIKA